MKCLIRTIFGIPCPGCGLTRAWLSVFKLDLKSAFYYHPLFWTIPIMIGLAIFYKGKYRDKFIIFFIFCFIIIYIIRLATNNLV